MNKLEGLLNKYKVQSLALGIELNKPASLKEIETFEERVNLKLPTEIKEFYLMSNGIETIDYLFRFIHLYEIAESKSELPVNKIHFAEYMIYSDTWEIVTNGESYWIINNDHKSCEDIFITNSIFDFIEKYLKGNGLFGVQGLYWQQEQILKAKELKPNKNEDSTS